MKTQKVIANVTSCVAAITFGISVMVILLLVPSGDQGYGYNDKIDFRVSHEIYKENHLTTTQVILFPAMSTYLLFDKNWGHVGHYGKIIFGFIMFVVSLLATIILSKRAEENWKALILLVLITGYFVTTFIYLILQGIINNGYSW